MAKDAADVLGVDAASRLADQFFDTVARGDTDTVTQMWADDIAVWHTGDPADQHKVQALRVIKAFMKVTANRRYELISRNVFESGFVQQHVLAGTDLNGREFAARICIVVVADAQGRITRIDEYFDPTSLTALMKGR